MQKISGTIKRHVAGSPSDYYSAWLKEDEAYVDKATLALPTVSQNLWKKSGVYDIDVCLDGSWIPSATGGFVLITTGEPIIVYTTLSGALFVEELGGISTQLPGVFDLVAIERGWKSTSDVFVDQGIVITAKVKNSNLIKTYVYKRTVGGLAWVPDMDIPMQFLSTSLKLHRLTDYRMGLTATGNELSELIITDRTYVSQAVPPEYLLLPTFNMREVSTDPIYINTIKVQSMTRDEVVLTKFNASDIQLSVYNLQPIKFFYGGNTDDSTIFLAWDQYRELKPGVQPNDLLPFLSAVDSTGARVQINSVEFYNYSLILRCAEFNSAVGDITATYTGSQIIYGGGIEQPGFTVTFTPVGLVPPDTDPPKPTRIISVVVL